jgi:hypothetical protein
VSTNKQRLLGLLETHLTEERAGELLRTRARLNNVIRALEPYRPRTFRRIIYGGDARSGMTYLERFKSRGTVVSDWATLMVGGVEAGFACGLDRKHPDYDPTKWLPTGFTFPCARVQIEVEFAIGSPIDFGFDPDDPDTLPFGEIQTAAEGEFGLSLATAQEGVELRLDYDTQPRSEFYRMAMAGVPLYPTYTALLRIGNDLTGMQLRTFYGWPHYRWQRFYPFVWVKSRRLLATGEPLSYQQVLQLAA